MFTGLVEDLGRVVASEPSEEGGRRATLRTSLDAGELAIGESVAVDGVCLTVAALGDGTFTVDLSEETLRRTTLGARSAGDVVHLERALRVGDRLGGHFVQGHVDGVGRIRSRDDQGEDLRFVVEVPDSLRRYLIEKGSVAVDGVSLTITELVDGAFGVAIVPHTAEVTRFGDLEPGTPVNIEVDMIGKYVERLMQFDETDGR